MARTDDELIVELRALGDTLDMPSANLAPDVARRLRAAPAPVRPRWHRTAPRLAIATAAVVAMLVVVGTLALRSGTRDAIADRLGIGGVDIGTSATFTPPAHAALQIGTEIRPAEAEDRAGYALFSPPATLGDPDSVFLLVHPWGSQVSYVYQPRDELPEVAGSAVGLLVTQFPGSTDENYVQKQLAPDSSLELVDIAGTPGFWISGAPHVFFYRDPRGQIQQETIRLAGNVLIWEAAGITLRIESALPRDDVIRIAESMTR